MECDRPRDKYYYVSRGLEVLAEGERRNYKPPAPGNPDMRQNLGFYYQLKIGNSDEKNTMRCLLEMSCIDPLDRAADRLWVDTDRGKKVKLDRFKDFCIQHPRLVRRLHDQLALANPEDIVRFLDENKDVPSRFEPPSGGPQQKESVVKDELEQFPILPPGRPAPKSRELSTTESVDVYFVCRNWYEYAQKPLPDPSPDPTVDVTPDPVVKRLPRYIAQQIFRSYPARAQAYMAEALEAEGWFDGDGWAIKGWFDKERGPNDPELRVGTEPKFYAGPSWDTAYRMYLDYGTLNGLYVSPSERVALDRQAELYRKTFKVVAGERGPETAATRQGELGESFRAHQRINAVHMYQNMTNFPEFLTQTDAERDAATVTARKYFYNAERLRRAGDVERAIPEYKHGWQLWTEVLLSYPRFARLSNVQEDMYETQQYYNKYVQKYREEIFRPLLIGVAQMAVWPYPPLDNILDSSQRLKVMPVRNHRGILDYVMFYNGPNALELKMALAAWQQATSLGMHITSPLGINSQLTGTLARDATPPFAWTTFVDADAANRVRDRLGLNRTERSAPAEKK